MEVRKVEARYKSGWWRDDEEGKVDGGKFDQMWRTVSKR